jgi:hypothetical protein
VDFGLDQLDVKRKNKKKLGDDFGIRIYLSDGDYADVTMPGGGGAEDDREGNDIDDNGVQMTETRLEKYTKVDEGDGSTLL